MIIFQNFPADGNLVFSPLSLGVVLLMTRFGAGGRTATQIDTALKFPYPIDSENDLLPFRLGYFKMLEKLKKVIKLNSLHPKNDLSFT